MLLAILLHLVGLGVVADDAMTQAAAMRAAGNYSRAAELFAQVAGQAGPRRLEALARAGECLEAAQEPTQALETYNRLLALNATCYWAEIALARKAELAFRRGDVAAARQCIGTLKEMFPDSPWSVCAKVTEARLSAGDVARAEAVYARETQAFEEYQQALGISDVDARLNKMEEIIAAYPETATATRAYASKAHLLWKKDDRDACIAHWLAVLERTAGVAPKSRIVNSTKVRLGSLYRALGRTLEAQSMYESLNSEESGQQLANKAAYCRITIDFAQMREDKRAGRNVSAQVESLVARCRTVSADAGAGKHERVQADMLPFEILQWGGQGAECIRVAEEFIQRYTGTEYKDEVAMAHFYAGWELTKAGRDPEALPHFQEVIGLTPGKKLLLNTDSIPRSHYHVWRILRETKAPRESVDAAAEALFSAFPESGYCEVIRMTRRKEARANARQ